MNNFSSHLLFRRQNNQYCRQPEGDPDGHRSCRQYNELMHILLRSLSRPYDGYAQEVETKSSSRWIGFRPANVLAGRGKKKGPKQIPSRKNELYQNKDPINFQTNRESNVLIC